MGQQHVLNSAIALTYSVFSEIIANMGIKVEVFSSPGCTKCSVAKEVLQKMATELGNENVQWQEVNVLTELDHAVALGVMSTPAIAIDGELVFTGLPSEKKLKGELEKRLKK